MVDLIIWLSLIALIAAPLISVIYLYMSWNRFRETIPFTPERKKQKVRLIFAAILASIFVIIYITVMVIYGVTVFFAK